MQADHLELIDFILEQAESQPVTRRVKIYRAAANICGNPAETKRLQQLANQLESADRRCRQVRSKLSRKETR